MKRYTGILLELHIAQVHSWNKEEFRRNYVNACFFTNLDVGFEQKLVTTPNKSSLPLTTDPVVGCSNNRLLFPFSKFLFYRYWRFPIIIIIMNCRWAWTLIMNGRTPYWDFHSEGWAQHNGDYRKRALLIYRHIGTVPKPLKNVFRGFGTVPICRCFNTARFGNPSIC